MKYEEISADKIGLWNRINFLVLRPNFISSSITQIISFFIFFFVGCTQFSKKILPSLSPKLELLNSIFYCEIFSC